jgi:DNA-binding MurR/RpiR family transcriptional regulator
VWYNSSVDHVQALQPTVGAIDQIRSLLPSLVPSEQRVARECVDHPEDVAGLSAADLAARTGTSAATVSRTCQSLGYRGFQHMRLMLVRDLGRRQRGGWQPGPGSQGRVEGVFEGARRALASAVEGFDFPAFDAAAAAIAQADQVLVVASGGSAPGAQLAALVLTVAGRAAAAPSDAVSQQLAAAALTPNDVCLVITESGSNSLTLGAADAARASGAVIVGLTAYARSRLGQIATHLLVAGAGYQAWDEDRIGGNVVHLLVLQALGREVGHLLDRAGRTRAVLSQAFGIVAQEPDES